MRADVVVAHFGVAPGSRTAPIYEYAFIKICYLAACHAEQSVAIIRGPLNPVNFFL
jgi:hypothetical protein